LFDIYIYIYKERERERECIIRNCFKVVVEGGSRKENYNGLLYKYTVSVYENNITKYTGGC
jgi:hypothetical protein